jgi:hypothetical protein
VSTWLTAPVDLHSDPDAPTGATRVLAVAGRDVVARLALAGGADRERVTVAVDVDVPELVGRAEARALVAAVDDVLDGRAGEVMVSDALVRDEARRSGYRGELRGAVGRPGGEPCASATARSDARGAGREVDTLTQVASLLPEFAVRRRRGLRSGDLVVATDDGRAGVRVRLPRQGALMPEPVAAAADTALAVKARFGRAASGIAALSFDHGIASRAIAGQAEGASGVVALTPIFVDADLLADERRARCAEGRRSPAARSGVRPFMALEQVVAHECWHYLDAEIRVSGTAYVAFNAALGEALGVETLEQALRGRERDAPPAWRAAHERLVADVSAYAGTSPREATAEMFSVWWCAPGTPSPVIARFGQLLEESFPR